MSLSFPFSAGYCFPGWAGIFLLLGVCKLAVRKKNMKKKRVSEFIANPLGLFGTPGRIRTCDLQLRRLTPYPLGYGRVGCDVWFK